MVTIYITGHETHKIKKILSKSHADVTCVDVPGFNKSVQKTKDSIKKLSAEIKELVKKISVSVVKDVNRVVTQCYEAYFKPITISLFEKIEFYQQYDDT